MSNIERLSELRIAISEYLDDSTTVNGYKLLKYIKENHASYIIEDAITEIEEIPLVSKLVEESINKYNKICEIVRNDCQPRG